MTRRALAAALMIASLCGAWEKKSKKPPDAMIESIRVTRDEGIINIDGRVKNTGEKPIRNLLLLFEFFGADRDSLTIQNGPVESELLAPGDEADFRLTLKAPVRAVHVKVEAQDKTGKDLRIENNGPFPIE